MRTSNQLVGLFNFLTFLLSIPILIGGVWLSSRANSTDCLKFLQWPLIVIGALIMVVSLAGISGACFRNTLLMRFYLWSMFAIIVTLLGFIIFAYAVTDKGGGRRLRDRSYEDYYLSDYSGWLKERVMDGGYWRKIGSCVIDSRVCARTHRDIGGIPESANMFFQRRLTPVESGCCKPPTECGYVYENETSWEGTTAGSGNPDCNKWSNGQEELCYACDSCKAGVLASIKKSWRRVSVVNVVVLILLALLYAAAVAAFRNDRRMDGHDDSYGHGNHIGMVKEKPSGIHF